MGCVTLHFQQAKSIGGSSPAKSILLLRSFCLAGWQCLGQLNTEPSFFSCILCLTFSNVGVRCEQVTKEVLVSCSLLLCLHLIHQFWGHSSWNLVGSELCCCYSPRIQGFLLALVLRSRFRANHVRSVALLSSVCPCRPVLTGTCGSQLLGCSLLMLLPGSLPYRVFLRIFKLCQHSFQVWTLPCAHS